MNDDRPVLGIILIIGFCLLAPLGDASAKFLGASLPVLQISLVRFSTQAVLLSPVLVRSWKKIASQPRIFWMVVLRTVLHIVGVGAFFTALLFLPLADALAIAFVMPFIMLILGKTILDEEIGTRRISACAVGFIGTLMIIQPSFAEVGLPALLPLLVALVFSLFMLVTRHIAKEIDPIGLQSVSGIMATAMLGSVFLGAHLLGWTSQQWITPQPSQWGLLVIMGILGTLAHLLMTWALRFAPSATLAPIQYLEIPFATLIGWMVFSELPNGLAAIGIAITIAAGLYVVHREYRVQRLAAASVA